MKSSVCSLLVDEWADIMQCSYVVASYSDDDGDVDIK